VRAPSSNKPGAGEEREVDAMRLKIRGLVATILVAAIAVPYIGYLINGEMPFIKVQGECRPLVWS
jgi:hypothetical protein